MNCRQTLRIVILLLFALIGACADEVRPPDVDAGQRLIAGASCVAQGAPTCPGSTPDAFSLSDVQPQSSSFQASRALSDYLGKTTVVALFAGW